MDKKNQTALQKEVLDSIPKNPKGRLILAPRSGKTRIIINLIKRDKYQSIFWVTPERKLADIDIPNEFVKWRAKGYLKKLTTTTYYSLPKFKGHYDLIVLDEDQNITELSIENLLNKSLTCNSMIGMTGTDTTHYDKQVMYRILGLPIIYSLSVDDAVNLDILSDYRINVIYIPMDKRKNMLMKSKNSRRTWYTSEIKNYNYLNQLVDSTNFAKWAVMKRLRAIGGSPSKESVAKYLLQHLEGKTICFANTIEQSERLCDYTYHSKKDATDYLKFQQNEINKIAMVNKGGIGHTYLGLENIILVQADSDKTGLSSQKISRILIKEDKTADIWILCLEGTQDSKWIENTLQRFNPNNIYRYRINELIKVIEEKNERTISSKTNS